MRVNCPSNAMLVLKSNLYLNNPTIRIKPKEIIAAMPCNDLNEGSESLVHIWSRNSFDLVLNFCLLILNTEFQIIYTLGAGIPKIMYFIESIWAKYEILFAFPWVICF